MDQDVYGLWKILNVCDNFYGDLVFLIVVASSMKSRAIFKPLSFYDDTPTTIIVSTGCHAFPVSAMAIKYSMNEAQYI